MISILQLIDEKCNQTQAMILGPTHELAGQYYDTAMLLGKKMKNLHVCKSVGGTDVRTNIKLLQQYPQIVVGTPGRVMDMIERRALDTRNIRIFCLDEADQMLDRGFKPQVQKIFSYLPREVQTILFSATMPTEVQDMTNRFMRQPATHLLLPKKNVPLEGINQFYIGVEEEYKLDTLMDLYGDITITQCLIFCNTKRKIEWLHTQLESKGYPIISMHGRMSTTERNELLNTFRAGSARIMIASDVLARGIDIQTISLVLNFDFPENRENYIHRIGRAGRFGRKGTAINLVTPQDVRNVREVERYYKTKIPEMPQNYKELL
jgi:translation initiation factor 4A